MVVGTVILLIGIGLGYFLRGIILDPVQAKFIKEIDKMFAKKATIVELYEEIDLGETEL